MSVLEVAKQIEGQIVAWRREVHQNPELGLETTKTEALVAGALSEMGIEVRTGVGGHGVVGLLRGEGRLDADGTQRNASGGEKTFAIRADMDALPVTEDTGLPFASKIPGRMHACGHDAHVAMLLGAAKILSGMKDKVQGNVKFIFQPGEEGPGGARPMILDGALENPKVDAIIGAHVGPLWDVGLGQLGFRTGPMMAATDRFFCENTGQRRSRSCPSLFGGPCSYRVPDSHVLADHSIQGSKPCLARGGHNRDHQGRHGRQHHPGLLRDERDREVFG